MLPTENLSLMALPNAKLSFDVNEELGGIVFPNWANKAYLNPEEMQRLRDVIRAQIEGHEPEYSHKNPDGSLIEISSECNAELYQKAVDDRVSGEINAFFYPIDYNQLRIISHFIKTFFVPSR